MVREDVFFFGSVFKTLEKRKQKKKTCLNVRNMRGADDCKKAGEKMNY